MKQLLEVLQEPKQKTWAHFAEYYRLGAEADEPSNFAHNKTAKQHFYDSVNKLVTHYNQVHANK